MKIDRANKRNVPDTSNLPNVSEGVMMFFQKIKVDVIKKKQIDGYTDESDKRCIVTMGVRQPMNSSQLVIKPEGERGWNWSTLYCLADLKVRKDDIVKILGIKYRIMADTNWAEYGYNQYDLLEDYKDEE